MKGGREGGRERMKKVIENSTIQTHIVPGVGFYKGASTVLQTPIPVLSCHCPSPQQSQPSCTSPAGTGFGSDTAGQKRVGLGANEPQDLMVHPIYNHIHASIGCDLTLKIGSLCLCCDKLRFMWGL